MTNSIQIIIMTIMTCSQCSGDSRENYIYSVMQTPKVTVRVPSPSRRDEEPNPAMPPAVGKQASQFEGAVRAGQILWNKAIAALQAEQPAAERLAQAVRGATLLKNVNEPRLLRHHKTTSISLPPIDGSDSKRIMPFGDTVTCIAIDDDADPQDGGVFAAGGVNNRVHIYDLNSCHLLQVIPTEESISSCQLLRLPPHKLAKIGRAHV